LPQDKLVVFEDKKIHRSFHKGEWYFSIIDIVEVLTGSPNPWRYWSNLKIQLGENEGFAQLYPKTVQLKLLAPDGKIRETDTANTGTVFRIIQSIPSSKAEPFKRWLAQVEYERIQEIAVNRDAQGFNENKGAAHMGGKIARNARLELEQESGQPVISRENYLGQLGSVRDAQKLVAWTEDIE